MADEEDKAVQIIKALAESEANGHCDEYCHTWCVFCDAVDPLFEDHPPDCLYRRAVEWVRAQDS